MDVKVSNGDRDGCQNQQYDEQCSPNQEPLVRSAALQVILVLRPLRAWTTIKSLHTVPRMASSNHPGPSRPYGMRGLGRCRLFALSLGCFLSSLCIEP